MTRIGALCCVAVVSILGQGALSRAQEKPPLAKSSKSPAAPQGEALRALVEQYFSAYSQKNLTVMMSLYSPDSPDRKARQQELEKYFASKDKITVSKLETREVSVETRRARLRVSMEVNSADTKTGSPTAAPAPSVRILEVVRRAGAWRILRDGNAFDDLAQRLVALDSDSERSVLYDSERELVTTSLREALFRLGMTYHRSQGDFPKAKKSFELMQQVAERIGDREGVSLALRDLGNLSNLQGDPETALQYYKRSLGIAETLGDKRLIAGALGNIGIIYDQLNNFAEALNYYNKTLELAEALNDKPQMAHTLHNIGGMNWMLGNDSEALAYYLRSLAIDESETHDVIGIAQSLNDIGNVYADQGNRARALEYYQKGLSKLEEQDDVPTRELLLDNLGALHQDQGDYTQALDYYKRSLALGEKMADKRGIANALLNVGGVEVMRGHYVASTNYFRRSLRLWEGMGDKWGVLRTLDEMGELQTSEGQYAVALATYRKALAIAESVGFQGELAKVCTHISREHYRKGEFQEALTLAQRAATLAANSRRRSAIWESRTAEGQAYAGLREPERARQAFEDAIAAVEELRGESAGGEEARESSFEGMLAPYYGMVELLVANNRSAEAFSYAERAKGRTLLDVLASGRSNKAKAMTGEESKHEQELQSALASLNRQIEAEMTASKADDQRLGDLRTQRENARLQYTEFQSELYAVHPELGAQRGHVQPISVEETMQLLPDSRSALLEFVVAEEKTYLFVLTRGEEEAHTDLRVYSMQIKAKDLGQEAERFRQQLAQRDLHFGTLAARLYRLLLQQAQSQLAGKTVLLIVPDGPLWNLPFQALEPRPGHYLVEDSAVAYAPSMTVLREMVRVRQRNNTLAAPRTLLAMGNPALGKDMAQHAEVAYRGARLMPLPEAETEVRTIEGLYGQTQAKVYFGAEASEDRFKAQAGEFRVIHLATHGIFDDSNPMYSNVLLSSAEGGREDGLLEAWEIMQMDLKADLVVLSACETARGRVSAGEGVIGLTWAFLVAGVPTTVVSQWKVESESTTELMLAFHRTLKAGEGRVNSAFATARALQHAEVQLLHSQQYAHPFYWAGFVVVGDPH